MHQRCKCKFTREENRVEKNKQVSRMVMGVSTLISRYNCNLYSTENGEYRYAGYSQLEPIAQMFLEQKNNASQIDFLLLCTEATREVHRISVNDYNERSFPPNSDLSKEEQEKQNKEWKEHIRNLPESVLACLDESKNERMSLSNGQIGYSAIEYLIYRICYYVTGKQGIFGEEEVARCFKNKNGNEGVVDTYELELKGKTLRFIVMEVNENDLNEGIYHTLKWIQDEHQKGDTLWIDTHGGFRDMVMVLSALVSLLKVNGIIPERVLGTQYDSKRQLQKIVEQKQVIEINRFVSGIEEFINYGSVRILEEYYENIDPENSLKGQLDAMKKISEGMQTCDLEILRQGLTEIKHNYSQKNQGKDLYLLAFMDYIHGDYENLLKNDENLIVYVIEYCFNRGLYQQTLTFMESGMPQWIHDKNIVHYEDQNVNVYRRFNKMLEEIKRNIKEQYEEKWEFLELVEEFRQKKNCFSQCICEKANEILREELNFERDSEEKIITFLILHKILKECRNQYNHAGERRRVGLQDIKDMLSAYLEFAKNLGGEL